MPRAEKPLSMGDYSILCDAIIGPNRVIGSAPETWRVIFANRLTALAFNSSEAAYAYLNMLIRGQCLPEWEK